MNLQTVKLTKLSICPCGYAVLLESIHLGTEYVVDMDSIRGGFTYGCGGCGKIQPNVRVVNADSVTNHRAGLRPILAELFGL